MSNNKILCYFTLAVVAVSLILTRVAVTWEDHPDVAIIDHFFDFHLDLDALVQDAQKEVEDKEKAKREHEENIALWVKDIESLWKDDDCRQFIPDTDK